MEMEAASLVLIVRLVLLLPESALLVVQDSRLILVELASPVQQKLFHLEETQPACHV